MTVASPDYAEALRLIRKHQQPGDTLGMMFMRVAKTLEATGAEEEMTEANVYVCSNPSCGAVWKDDPKGHCRACIKSDGGGWSTMRRPIRDLPPGPAGGASPVPNGQSGGAA